MRRIVDDSGSPAVNEPAVRFQRANFVVSDLDRALAFYRDVLGFTLEHVQDSPRDSYSYPVFGIDRGASLRFALLSAPGQARVMALTEIRGMALATVPGPRRSAIVLDVGDIDGVVSRSRAAGLQVHPEERLVTHDGRTGREVGIVDPDGNLVVIYTITSGSG
jgi:catechol 2,3-dioxygenase-like lactoylglutathione lyase family enzyme